MSIVKVLEESQAPLGAACASQTAGRGPKRRREVEFTAELRTLTEEAIAELHRLVRGFQITELRFEMPALPAAVFKPACEECSLYEICLPRVTGASGVVARAARRLFEI
jgi:hypothetical protein